MNRLPHSLHFQISNSCWLCKYGIQSIPDFFKSPGPYLGLPCQFLFHFFAISGFTSISSILPPEKISDMLDRLYQNFDQLSLMNGIFKVSKFQFEGKSVWFTLSESQLFVCLYLQQTVRFFVPIFGLFFCFDGVWHCMWPYLQVETIGDAWMGVTNLVEDQVSDPNLKLWGS